MILGCIRCDISIFSAGIVSINGMIRPLSGTHSKIMITCIQERLIQTGTNAGKAITMIRDIQNREG